MKLLFQCNGFNGCTIGMQCIYLGPFYCWSQSGQCCWCWKMATWWLWDRNSGY